MRRFLERLTRGWLPAQRIPERRADGDLYLERWVLAPGVRLHCIHRPDDDLALHTHPWRWAFAIILAGGYREERLRPATIAQKWLRPGGIMFLSERTAHRIAELRDGPSWSLFVHGPRVDTWYFVDRWTRRVCEWSEYLEARRNNTQPRWVAWTNRR